MQVIHSFWSKPAFHSEQNYNNSRRFGGWLNYKYFLYSQALSCLTLRRENGKITLFTDDKGAELFIDQLRLPYDEVSLQLNRLANEDHRLWILGKLLTISMQERPFVHVDNDVYMWEKLPLSPDRKYLLAQSELRTPEVYLDTLRAIQKQFTDLPDCLRGERQTIANVGVVGGNNLDLFHKLCSISSDLLKNNKCNLEKVNLGGVNQIIEEYLFSCLAVENGFSIKYIVESVNDKAPMSLVLKFNQVPLISKYIHLVGFAKQNQYGCEQLDLRFRYEFPKEHTFIYEYIRGNYPALYSHDVKATSREASLMKCIDIVYSNDLKEIWKKKIKLRREYRIERIDINGSSIYALVGPDELTGVEHVRNLNGTDILFVCFSTPVSLEEVLEEYIELKKGLTANMEKFRFDLLDWSLEHILIAGILEFSDAR